MKISVKTAVFLISDVLLTVLQQGVEIAEVKIGDKISIRQNNDLISLFVGDTCVVESGEVKNSFLAHHRALQALSFEARGAFSKVVKGGDFGESYIYDIPAFLKYNFQEVDKRTCENYSHLLQSLSWMLREGVTEWTVA